MSILEDVRDFCDVESGSTVFDKELLLAINNAFAILSDNGFNPPVITATTLWSDVMPEGKFLEDAKAFVCIKTKLLFDPPSNGTILGALKEMADEALWRVSRRLDE